MNTGIGSVTDSILFNNLPVTVQSFSLGDSFVTEIQTQAEECVICRGIARTAVDSMDKAWQAFSRRLSYARGFELTVGG